MDELPVAALRSLQVMRLLNNRIGGVSFGEVARLLELSNSSCMRLLKGLMAAGYLRKDDEGLYQLGALAAELGRPADLHERLLRLGRGYLDSLMRRTGQTAITVYYTGEAMVCVDRVEHGDASPLQEPGHLVGDLRAAPWGWWFRSIDAWRESPQGSSGDRQATRDEIIAGLEAAGAHGSTYHAGERRRLAAPVYLGERIVACLCLGGTSTSMPEHRLPPCRQALEEAAQSLSRLLATDRSP